MALPETFSIHGPRTSDESILAEDRMLPRALRDTSFITRSLCLLAMGRPDLELHWESLQSEDAFKNVRERQCSILTNTVTAAGLLLATSGVFVTAVSPAPYFDYTSPAPYFLLFISLMMAMIAMLTSGLGMIRWLHADRQWTQEQIKQGGYFLLSHLLSMVMPMFFAGLSLNCFIFAMLIAGFCSQNTVCLILTAVWLVAYVVGVGSMSIEFMWMLARYLRSR
ncbi:uncharacterized protein F5147DRAFT_707858 [Suillus discolor]|uniref:Uncharacterized protein n=1 Tax=Suillus discolor TaxID=1912936 RepID=A0A9P7F2S9_9AGAM|nr:uncharacterized protein F5147DRAFT_707847 [Suillus discolor]XP_041290125.1 uncharacterized protein F5147DRAFT_707858 [Suillus discolor]KAG2102256.1 hypothetical protein F5147DRAFT_707847 [Suillus discolor]KAG2102259.1 hypothetical protein F5147DRAFT_707858 [Suillus discolor]